MELQKAIDLYIEERDLHHSYKKAISQELPIIHDVIIALQKNKIELAIKLLQSVEDNLETIIIANNLGR